MAGIIFLVCVFLFFATIVVPIWAFAKITAHESELLQMKERTIELEKSLGLLRLELARKTRPLEAAPPATVTQPVAPPPVPREEPRELSPFGILPPLDAEGPEPTLAPLPTPPPPIAGVIPPTPPVVAAATPLPVSPVFAKEVRVPPLPEPPFVEAKDPEPEFVPLISRIDWEQFMGAKLFAWLGGFALFLGVVFFIKYSFEHNLVPPQVRVAIGYLIGLGLVVGGLRIPRERYRITGQTLVATGVICLYAVTFACNSLYHFAFFTAGPTFALMTLITAVAFLLAVRLDAQVVAILGMLGGFITPALVNTGRDNPFGLFGYDALLVIGLAAVALHRRWFYLVPLGAAGTMLTLIGWSQKFYSSDKVTTAMGACVAFCALFLLVNETACRLGRSDARISQTALGVPGVAFCFAGFFLTSHAILLQPGLFFGFVVVVSALALLVALREKQPAVVGGCIGATLLLLATWSVAGTDLNGDRVAIIVYLTFAVIYLAVYLIARALDRFSPVLLWSAVATPAAGFLFAFFRLEVGPLGVHPALFFTLVFGCDAVLMLLSWLDERVRRLHFVAGFVAFGLLALWSAHSLTNALLPWALGIDLLFAILHTAFPLLLARRRPESGPTWWSQLFPALGLVLMLVPICSLSEVSFLVWPAIFLVDAIAIGLALATSSLFGIGLVLLLTVVATATSLLGIHADTVLDPTMLLVVGAFAVVFFAAGVWLVQRIGDDLPEMDMKLTEAFGIRQLPIPALSALLPFLLLIMICARLDVPNPSQIFGLGLLLVVLTLGLARILGSAWLPACALAGMAAVEYTWQQRHPAWTGASGPLVWFAFFYAVFAVYPLLFRTAFRRMTGPWAVAASSGLVYFYLIYETLKPLWASEALGLIPALFVPMPLASLVLVARPIDAANPKQLNQIAWFGGVTLFFITLIFPIQFDRQWLTVAWALEGAALLWLYHRVPHEGLRGVGLGLLAVVFVRLALNPAVFSYHLRGDVPVLNWYLYAYGVAIVALFAAGRLLAPPRHEYYGLPAQAAAPVLAVILLFLLINIEIADYFTAPGSRSLTFEFSGNLARDMSYTIAWALFALGLLVTGIWKSRPKVRYAAITLLSIAFLKLFFSDLAHLEALYRIGALFAVAVIAIVASFAYQKFLPKDDTPDDAQA